jgi:phage replication-related protein YjqB (UPF0714/DUF867 family)
MTDLYSSFQELKASESPESFSIEFENRNLIIDDNNKTSKSTFVSFLFFAPHGGKIEGHTTEIARTSSAKCAVSYYSFLGTKRSNNRDLHITSTKFDEPILVENLLPKHNVAVAFHGTKDSPTESIFFVGGLMRSVARLLVEVIFPSKNFKAVLCEDKFSGKQKENVCNRASFGKGIQFEMTMRLRCELVEDHSRMQDFVECMTTMMKMIQKQVFYFVEEGESNEEAEGGDLQSRIDKL